MFMLTNSIALLGAFIRCFIKQLFNHYVHFTLSFKIGYYTNEIEILYRQDTLSLGNKAEGEVMLLTLIALNCAELKQLYNI